MKDDSDTIGRWTFIGLCVGALIVLAANGMSCLPDSCGSFWGGGKGYAEILISIGTLGAAVVAGSLAWRSYRMNTRSALAARFQKGIELLGEPGYSANVGAVSLLVEVMRSDPDNYIAPCTKVLLAFGVERSRGFFEGPLAGQWTAEVESSMEAVLGCASVDFDRRWPANVDIRGHLRAHNICARRTNIYGIDFRRVAFAQCVWEKMTFVACNFAAVEMVAAAWESLAFEECDLRGAKLIILEAKRPDSVNFPVRLRKCLVDDNTRINGKIPTPTGWVT